ncbi:MAG: carboxypeptidase-like regulatory domain-containing protein [Cyclobacteriaceae bacterium]|nr:carboxypeptidase-like regulatory domain-containing protein [Cyclobacteriaceae bacterium]
MKTNSISNSPVSGRNIGQVFTLPGLRNAMVIALLLWSVAGFAQASGQPDEHFIKGVVLSAEEGSPLTGVNIYLKDTNIGTFSDADGRFWFPRKLKAGEILVFSFVGLKKQEYVVAANTPESLEIRMEADPLNILGAVWIDAPEKPRQKRRSLAGN